MGRLWLNRDCPRSAQRGIIALNRQLDGWSACVIGTIFTKEIMSVNQAPEEATASDMPLTRGR
jgi:hypothetical protein